MVNCGGKLITYLHNEVSNKYNLFTGPVSSQRTITLLIISNLGVMGRVIEWVCGEGRGGVRVVSVD